ncbi:MAG: sigma-70 family RNA polymerase sigma factor [Clostridia bacterium]|nr:sigma-70 family RNA polymerase sigma factor [Clostridia bacterium]
MKDEKIIELYFSRDEDAIKETEKKYGALCRYIASNFLSLREDREECESDVMLALWNSIPPARPENLPGYIAEVTRRQAVNKSRAANAWKRGGQVQIVSDEFLSMMEDGTDLAEQYESRRAGELISVFLRGLKPSERQMFLMRYWFDMSPSQIARQLSCGESKVKMTLMRTRTRLAEYLRKEGIML